MPPILLLLVQYKMLNKIIVDWYLQVHVKILQNHNPVTCCAGYNDFKMCLDVLVVEGYKDQVLEKFLHDEKFQDLKDYVEKNCHNLIGGNQYKKIASEWHR